MGLFKKFLHSIGFHFISNKKCTKCNVCNKAQAEDFAYGYAGNWIHEEDL